MVLTHYQSAKVVLYAPLRLSPTPYLTVSWQQLW